MRFDWKEEERITDVALEHLKEDNISGYLTSIAWRRGNDFVVVVWYNVDCESPEWDKDTKYYEQHVQHVCFRVIWKKGKRFLRVLESHEGSALTWIGSFACGSCAMVFGYPDLRWRR